MRKVLNFCICLSAICAALSARGAAPTDGLVAYYPFDGNATDATTNHLDGVATGVTAATDRFGNAAGALGFDGSAAWVDLGNPTAFNFEGSFTIACWVKLTNNQVNTYIVAKYDFGNSFHNYGLGTAGNSQPYAFVMGDGPGFSDVAGAGDLNDGQWHALALVYDVNSGITLYLDNLVSGSVPAANLPPFVNNVPLMVGRTASGQFFAGTIDDLRIYNRALSPDEVSSLGPTPEMHIIVQPHSLYLAAGEMVQLRVTASTVATSDPITYQWTKNGIDIPNGTNATLIASGPVSGSDVYQAHLKAGSLEASTDPATLTVPALEQARLLAHYTFEHDTTNTIVDETGVFSGVVSNATHVPGRIGGLALKFDGASTIARIACAASPLDLAATPYTIAWWMKAESKAGTQTLMWMGDGDPIGGYAFAFTASFSAWYHNSGADLPMNSSMRLATNWTHVALVWNGSERVLYLNGAMSNRVATANAIISERDDDLFLGTRPGTTAFYKGSLDDLRIYNYALASDEIQQLAAVNPETPLIIAQRATDLLLTWPVVDSSFTYRLEVSTSLGGGAQWTPASGLAQKSGDYFLLPQPIPTGTTFYRLRKL